MSWGYLPIHSYSASLLLGRFISGTVPVGGVAFRSIGPGGELWIGPFRIPGGERETGNEKYGGPIPPLHDREQNIERNPHLRKNALPELLSPPPQWDGIAQK
jgi:hypothetical protein